MFRSARRLVLLLATLLLVPKIGSCATVLVLGDSLAVGLGVEKSEAFPALLEESAKAAGHAVTVINAGVSGDTSAGGLRRLDWLLNRPIDILILELGANDGLRGIAPETTAANLQAIIDKARKKFPDLAVIVAGMRMPPNLGADYGKAFAEIFPKLANANHAHLVPFLLEDVGGVAKLNQSDRIHPTAAGQRVIAANVWKVLEPLLAERAAKAGD
jgi:acyl-CoA thioesterase-1